MARVIQVRNAPVEFAAHWPGLPRPGLSLTKLVLLEPEHLASRAQVVHDNACMTRETKAKVQARVEGARSSLRADLAVMWPGPVRSAGNLVGPQLG